MFISTHTIIGTTHEKDPLPCEFDSASGGGGWGHPQGDMHIVGSRVLELAVKPPWLGLSRWGDMHMVASRVGCKSTMVGTEWVNA